MTVIDAAPAARPETPLPAPRPAVIRPRGPLGPWTHRSARIEAVGVRLNGLGVRTHANWVFFRLPFDTTDLEHVREVSFEPTAIVPTDVGALRMGGVCIATTSLGDVRNWSRYTVSGISYSERFSWHNAPPTDDPSIVGINVPTRVANHVACGRDEVLRQPRAWSMDVSWDER